MSKQEDAATSQSAMKEQQEDDRDRKRAKLNSSEGKEEEAQKKLKKAREELSGYCRQLNLFGDPSGTFNIERSLQVLHENPSLASANYWSKDIFGFGDDKDILCFFVAAFAPLETVKTVCNLMTPDALKDSKALRCALHDGAEDGVTEYLISLLPSGLNEDWCYESLKNRDRVGDEKMRILDLVPLNSLFKYNECSGEPTILKRLVAGDEAGYVDRTLVNYIFHRYALYVKTRERENTSYQPELDLDWEDFIMDTQQSETLSILIPSLKIFMLVPQSWTTDGLLHVLRSLARSSVSAISICLPMDFFCEESGHFLTAAFVEMVTCNRDLRTLDIYKTDLQSEEDGGAALCDTLMDVVSGNNHALALNFISIHDLKMSSAFICKFLSVSTVPGVSFRNVTISHEAVWQMSDSFSLNKHIQTLSFLQDSLDSGIDTVLWEAVLAALENGNTTLTKWETRTTTDVDAKIRYFCNLNKFGRAKAQSSDTAREEFVSLLQKLIPGDLDTLWASKRGESMKRWEESQAAEEDISMVNVCYGLLRMAPIKWT